MSNSTEKNITRVDAKEFAAASEEAKNSVHTYVHKFSKPFNYEGEEYSELTFDWGKLTGRDSLAIEAEIAALGKALIAPEFSGDFLVRMASRACIQKIGYDVLLAAPMKDYNKIRGKARSFLLNAGL